MVDSVQFRGGVAFVVDEAARARVFEGDLAELVAADGTVFDGLNDAITFPDVVAVTYDEDDNVVAVTEDGRTTSYTYNEDGTIATDTRGTKTRSYSYSAGGDLETIIAEA